MSACFEILKSFAEKLNYHTIEIQSVETYEMQQWCRKNGFKPNNYALAITDEKGREVIVGDYDLTLKCDVSNIIETEEEYLTDLKTQSRTVTDIPKQKYMRKGE